MDLSKDKSVMGSSREPRKRKSLLMGPNSQSSTSSKTSVLTTIGKTLMDSAVNDYYAQTVSSQFMTHETDVLDISFPWKDRGSESLISPYIKKPKLILKSEICGSLSTENLFTSCFSQKRELSPDFSVRICNEENICTDSVRTIISSQKRSLSPDFSDRVQNSESPSQLVVTSISKKIKNHGHYKTNSTNKTQMDLFAVFSQEESDSSIKLISKKPKLDESEVLNKSQEKNNTYASDDDKIQEIQIYDDSISSPTFLNDIFEKNISNSTIEETYSQPVKSLAEKIEQIKAQHAQMKEAMKRKSNLFEENTLIPHVPCMEGMSSQKLSTAFNCSELETIETSPNHKVDQWLNNHLNKGASASSSPLNYIELKIEDYDSPEKGNTCMQKGIEIPDINKENQDPSSTVEPRFLDTQTRDPLDLEDCVNNHPLIEYVNSEQAKHENTFRIVEVNTEKSDAIYFNKTDKTFESTQIQKKIEEVNSEEVGCETNYRIIEDVNTEKCDETIVENQNTYRQIEEFNTEKHERTLCSETIDPFGIECSDSPEIIKEVESAARILMSFSQSHENDNDTNMKKKIKFKPGSLGARLHLELKKQKSAAEIWNYEVTKASQSQDSNTLAELFRERLDLTMVSCWNEYSHIIVKAVKTKKISDESDNHNTVLLLLKSSDFPKRFQQKEGQNFSIFPPWNSQWVPELGQSFLTNIQRIKFSSTSKSSIQEIRTERSLPLDLMDEDFYIKLIGLEGGLIKNEK